MQNLRKIFKNASKSKCEAERGGFCAKPLACLSLAGPDLISQVQTLSPTDAARMHNREGPLWQMLWGRAHTLFLVQTPPPFKPQLYTQMYT